MSADTQTDAGTETLQDPPAPACVMSFNASDASGAGGVAGDIATIAAMGAHALPVVTSILMRDTAEVFVYPADRACAESPIVFRFVGTGSRARVLDARTSCTDH